MYDIYIICTIYGSSGSKAFDTGKSVLLFPGEHTKKCMLYTPCLKAWVLLKKPAKAGDPYPVEYYLGPKLLAEAIEQVKQGATATTPIKVHTL